MNRPKSLGRLAWKNFVTINKIRQNAEKSPWGLAFELSLVDLVLGYFK